MNRREYHKIQTAWDKHCKERGRAIDKYASVHHISRACTEAAVLWSLHENGAYIPSYRQYKKEHPKLKTVVQHLLKVLEEKTEMKMEAECEKCGYRFYLELKPAEFFRCPKCRTKYNALKVVNDEENKSAIERMNGESK